MGKAMVLSTPKGQLIKNLIDDKVRIGISSRALGTVSEGTVNDDLNLLTYDVVASPSNPGSFVNGILEGVEFNTKEDKESIDELKEELSKAKSELEELKAKLQTITEEIDYKNKITLLESL